MPVCLKQTKREYGNCFTGGMDSRRTGAEELTITTSCPACDRAFEVALELRPSADRVQPVTIVCPYCWKEARIDTSRRLLWVATTDD